MSGALDLRSFAHYSSVRLANIIGSRVSQTLPSFPAWLNILPGPELKAIKQVVTSSKGLELQPHDVINWLRR